MQRRLVGAGLMRRNADGVLFFVSAGANQTLTSTVTAQLAGTAATGGKPAYTYKWTVVSKPIGSTVVFSDDTSLTSTATVDVDGGAYVLRLRATDANSRTADSYVTITSALSVTGILDSLLVEYWDSELGIALSGGAVDTWTGQKLGYVVQAPAAAQRPVYGADGVSFNGHNVVQCAITGSKQLLTGGNNSGSFAAALSLSGSRPYVFYVFRTRNHDGIRVVEFQTPGATNGVITFYDDGNFKFFANGAQTPTVIKAGNVVASFAAGWSNVATGTHFSLNGTDTVDALDGATDANIQRLSVGGLANTVQVSDTSHAYIGFCSSEPTAAQKAALLVWSRGVYGTP